METFVIRVWTPAPETGAPAESLGSLHGVVEHIGSRRAAPFTDGAQLLDLIAAGLEQRAKEHATTKVEDL